MNWLNMKLKHMLFRTAAILCGAVAMTTAFGQTTNAHAPASAPAIVPISIHLTINEQHQALAVVDGRTFLLRELRNGKFAPESVGFKLTASTNGDGALIQATGKE